MKIVGMRFFKDNIILKIIFLYSLSCVITAAIFYKLIPILLNYAPGYSYIDKLHGISYFWQYALVVFLCLLLGNIFLYLCLRKVTKIEDVIYDLKNYDYQKISLMKKRLFILPYQIYLIQIIIPIIIIPIVAIPIFIIQKASLIIFFRLLVLIIVFFTLFSVLNLVFTQESFKKLLLKFNSDSKINGIRISIVSRLFLHLLPILITAILFTSLIGYSYNIRDKGDLISEFYIAALNDTFSQYKDEKLNILQINDALSSVKSVKGLDDNRFIITPKGEVITFDDKKLEDYFLQYLHELSINNGGYVYDVTGETRGVIINISGEDGDYIVGIKFNLVSNELVVFYSLSIIAILSLASLVLYVTSKSISNDIKNVANRLNETSSGKDINIYSKLPITSNDEISDLVLAFNKIQELVNGAIDMKNVELRQSKEEIALWYRSTVNTIRLAIDAKDHYTLGHSDRVSKYAVIIGEALNLSKKEIDLLRESGTFHDVGKIGIDDNILKKAGKLTMEEYEEIKKHPQRGAVILSAVSMFENIIPIVLYHHERYDGKGYPKGLSGEEIPFLARILSIADAFDAMTTNRIYQKKLSLKEAIDELENGSGTQFDPYLVKIMIELINDKYINVT